MIEAAEGSRYEGSPEAGPADNLALVPMPTAAAPPSRARSLILFSRDFIFTGTAISLECRVSFFQDPFIGACEFADAAGAHYPQGLAVRFGEDKG